MPQEQCHLLPPASPASPAVTAQPAPKGVPQEEEPAWRGSGDPAGTGTQGTNCSGAWTQHPAPGNTAQSSACSRYHSSELSSELSLLQPPLEHQHPAQMQIVQTERAFLTERRASRGDALTALLLPFAKPSTTRGFFCHFSKYNSTFLLPGCSFALTQIIFTLDE